MFFTSGCIFLIIFNFFLIYSVKFCRFCTSFVLQVIAFAIIWIYLIIIYLISARREKKKFFPDCTTVVGVLAGAILSGSPVWDSLAGLPKTQTYGSQGWLSLLSSLSRALAIGCVCEGEDAATPMMLCRCVGKLLINFHLSHAKENENFPPRSHDFLKWKKEMHKFTWRVY